MRDYFLTKSKKGMSLPMILIVITVVLSMIVTLLSLSVQQLKATKSDNHIEHTYFAGDSMIEMTIARIQEKLNNATFLANIQYNGVTTYVNDIRNELIQPTNYIVKINPEDITIGASDQKAKTIVKSIDVVSANIDPNNNNLIRFKLRINVSTSYHTEYKAGSKETTAIKEFVVTIPDDKKPKLAAINSIGDLVATGPMDSKIIGDVKVYGSSPKEPVKVEQEYYGGILSRNEALLRIEGNSFVRSFIRTGIKDDSVIDKSQIYITRSAIAQGLHSFGNGSYIYVHKDAYTFDDVEMNAENSAIIINRNLFGLEDGSGPGGNLAGIFHDTSSGIVNSAPLYFLNSDGSLKSKIIVNGPVFLNGGTFRVNEDGTVMYGADSTHVGQPQIEDGSIAWDTEEEAPYYTTFENPATDFEKQSYHEVLLNAFNANNDRIKGYGNLIQALKVCDYDENDKIDAYIKTKVEPAMGQGYSDGLLDKMDYKPAKIMGYTTFEIAANAKMFFMYPGPTNIRFDFVRPTDKTMYNDVYLNYSKIKTSYPQTKWDGDWDIALDDTNTYPTRKFFSAYQSDVDSYNNKIPEILNTIKNPLMSLTQEFMTRTITYPKNGLAGSVNHTSTKLGNGDPVFETFKTKLSALSTNKYFKYVPNSGNTEVDLASLVSADPDKFYVFFNDVPTQDLVISGPINGIVFTTGRVILKENTDPTKPTRLRGCIIAAGKGYSGGSQADESNIPKIDSSNVALLEDGTFAGVLFQGTAEVDFHYDDPKDPEAASDIFFDEFALVNNTAESDALVSQLKTIFE